MEPIKFYKMPIGTDTEFFFKTNGNIIESKKILKNGYVNIERGKITTDGIQGEINPEPSVCRETLKKNIQSCIIELNDICDTSFVSNVEISNTEFESISEESKVFGCKPSYDVYNNCKPKVIEIDGHETLQRTAGGHIHLGYYNIFFIIKKNQILEKCIVCNAPCKETINNWNSGNIIQSLIRNNIDIRSLKTNTNKISKDVWNQLSVFLKNIKNIDLDNREELEINISNVDKAINDPELLIPLLDLFCGIPSILVDKTPDALLRRKLYGKAGDYRTPAHGVEYRTLSNFWIKSYQMMSLFTGLARHALLFAAHSIDKPEILDELYSFISKREVEEAINTNNFNKAKEIFLSIEKPLVESTSGMEDNFPINSNTISSFKEMIISGYVDSDNVFENWKNNSDGWESWCVKYFPANQQTDVKFNRMCV